jgi:putative membrane protein
LTVETAGYGPGGAGGRGSQVAVPIAGAERVRALARDVEPFGEPTFDRPPGRVRRRYVIRYLLALGAITAVVGAALSWASIQAPWYALGLLAPLVLPAAHLKWRHRGVWAGPDHVVTRNGVWRRSIKVVPYYRVQTVVDSRSIFQRRYGLATVTVDTAGSVSVLGREAAAVDVAIDNGVSLRETLGTRLNDALQERRQTAARGS